MDKQNVTLSFPKNLLKKAKMLAAQSDKSLSQLLRESLEEKVKESADYQKAKNRQLKLLRDGLNLGTNGDIGFSREELHERR